jgi:hypothetical protein
MSSCDNSNIRKNYIVQGGNEFDIISACTGVYTNNLYNCTGDTITIQSTNLSANTINATVYLSGGTNLLDIFSGDSNTFVTGFTYDNSNNLTISRSDNVSFGVNITEFSGITVNGVLSACTGIYTSNLYGCSPITVQDNLILNSGLTFNTISNNNTIDRLLVVSTGGTVEYRDANSLISGSTFVTGFTYDNANKFTIERNDDVDLSATINVVTGLTVNGTLSAITIDSSIILSGGTNLTNIIESLDTYVTGGTVSIPATDNDNSGKIGLFYKNSDGTPRTLPFEDTYSTGATYDNVTSLATFDKNDGTSFTLNLSSIDVNDTFVTGFTYDDINTFTITRNDGTAFTQSITVLSATTISGGTLFGDGSNLTGISTQDTFVTGGTYSDLSDTISFTNNTGGTFNVTGITDTFVTGQTFSNSTYILSTTRNDGVTLNTNLSVLASDVFVVSGVYDPSTGIVTYTNSTGGTFQVSGFTTGMTDSYTTDAYLSGTEIRFDNNIQGTNFYNVDLLPLLSGKTDNTTFNTYTSDTQTILDSKISGATNLSSTGIFAQKNGDDLEFKGLTSTGGSVTITNDSTTVNLEVVGSSDTNSFSTGGTVTQSATSGDSKVIVQIVGNSGFTPYNITGLTDTFINDFSISSNTFTVSQNDGTSFVATADTIDLATVLSAVTFDIGTSGSISATTFNGTIFSGGTFYGDGSNLTGITDTFVTGTTFGSNQAVLTRNDNFDVISLSGTNDVTLTNPSTNQIVIDVNGLKYFISETSPTGVTISNGYRWFNTSIGSEFVYIDDGDSSQWVQPLIQPGPQGPQGESGNPNFITTGITTSSETLTTGFTYYGVSYVGNVDLTLPDPTGSDGFNFIVKDEGGNASTYRIRLIPSVGLIDGNVSVDMANDYQSHTLVARNNNWWIV